MNKKIVCLSIRVCLFVRLYEQTNINKHLVNSFTTIYQVMEPLWIVWNQIWSWNKVWIWNRNWFRTGIKAYHDSWKGNELHFRKVLEKSNLSKINGQRSKYCNWSAQSPTTNRKGGTQRLWNRTQRTCLEKRIGSF